MSPVDQKVIDEKVQTGKALDKDEQKAFLSQQGPVDGYTKVDVEDMSPEAFDDTNETKVGEGEKKPVVDEAKAKEAEAKQKEEVKAKAEEKAPENKVDFFVRLERELAKPDDQEDLNDFSTREKAYYRQMRLDRKNRQKAESERDASKLNELRMKRELDEAKKSKVEEVDPIEELKKKDPTDYMTVAEVTALVDKVAAKKEAKEEAAAEEKPAVDPRQLRYLKMCEKEARDTHPEDFDTVMAMVDDIISNNQNHLTELAKTMVAGENPALKAYELIKADPEFAKLLPVAQTKIEARKTAAKKPEEKAPQKSAEESAKEKRAKEAEEALEKNKTKTKTTGHVEAAGDTGDEPSWDEISKMSDREFAKLPRKTRQKYLAQMEEV